MEKVTLQRMSCNNRSIIRRKLPAKPLLTAGRLHPVLARVFQARDLSAENELEYSLHHLASMQTLKGIDQAVAVLRDALDNETSILIIGDFDVDGATSTALAVRALRLMGAVEVDYLVPNRFTCGYGLTPEIVAIASEYKPGLIITVDNGISSMAGVEAAAARGIPVLITDHHLPGDRLPAVAAIVNPNQPGDAFPSKNLAGVGVIFYLMLALRARLREEGWFAERGIAEPNLAQLLDLVALGTVADVVPLDYNNRILVAQGLARIRSGRCCAGIQALIEVAGRRQADLVAADLGFALGPRLNAAGRLDDMALGIECLLADSIAEARELAGRLDGLNRERRAIESEMKADALAIVEELHMDESADLPIGLCLFSEEWHQGVIGILASRIKDRLHRPVIAFAPGEGDEIKGSARSVPGLHIRDALDAVAARHPGLLRKFGGHAMAAGLTLHREQLEPFRRAFDEEVRCHLEEEQLYGRIYSDGELQPEHLNIELAELIRRSGPWGQGFPEPLFDGIFEIVQRRIVGERHLKLVLKPPQSDSLLDAIAFNTTDSGWPEDTGRVEVAYRLDVNEYRNRRNLQLMLEHIRPL